MALLTPEQFEELWETQGLKYRIGDHYEMLCTSGLRLPFDNFLSKWKNTLWSFLVEGEVRRQPEQQGAKAVRWWERIQRRKR